MATIEVVRDEEFYEVVDGVRREWEPMGAFETVLASTLLMILGGHAEQNGLGWGATETLFQLDPDGDLQLRPDVAFVSAERWPADRAIPQGRNAIDVVPDLVVEVISPSNMMNEVLDKVRTYFRVGVRRVWVVMPLTQQIYDYASQSRVTILEWDDIISGGDVVPGFEAKVSAFFRRVLPNG